MFQSWCVSVPGLVVLILWISSACSTIQEVQWMVFHPTGTISLQAYQISMVMDVFMSMYNIHGLLTKWSRCLDIGQVTEAESRSINSQKKKRDQYPATNKAKQAWSIKDLLYGFRGNFSPGTRQVVLSRQNSSIFPAWVVNHSARFGSSCPLTELAI